MAKNSEKSKCKVIASSFTSNAIKNADYVIEGAGANMAMTVLPVDPSSTQTSVALNQTNVAKTLQVQAVPNRTTINANQADQENQVNRASQQRTNGSSKPRSHVGSVVLPNAQPLQANRLEESLSASMDTESPGRKTMKEDKSISTEQTEGSTSPKTLKIEKALKSRLPLKSRIEREEVPDHSVPTKTKVIILNMPSDAPLSSIHAKSTLAPLGASSILHVTASSFVKQSPDRSSSATGTANCEKEVSLKPEQTAKIDSETPTACIAPSDYFNYMPNKERAKGTDTPPNKTRKQAPIEAPSDAPTVLVLQIEKERKRREEKRRLKKSRRRKERLAKMAETEEGKALKTSGEELKDTQEEKKQGNTVCCCCCCC